MLIQLSYKSYVGTSSRMMVSFFNSVLTTGSTAKLYCTHVNAKYLRVLYIRHTFYHRPDTYSGLSSTPRYQMTAFK